MSFAGGRGDGVTPLPFGFTQGRLYGETRRYT